MSIIHENFRLANDPDAGLEKLVQLVYDDEFVRGALALNPSTPNSTLVKLFSDASQYLQECLKNRNEPH